MAEIERVNDWLLGDYKVSPNVPVCNTKQRLWLPNESGVFTSQALHYAVMYHIKLQEALKRHSSEEVALDVAHRHSLLNTHAIAETANRRQILDPYGNQYKNIPVDRVSEVDELADLGYTLDTETMRNERSMFYLQAAGVKITWTTEAPRIPVPLSSEQLYPDGIPVMQVHAATEIQKAA